MGTDTLAFNTGPEEVAALLKVLADPNRLRIFETLMRGVSCNGWLTAELGLPANLLSHHLKVLRAAGLIQDRRDEVDGRWIYYQVDRQMLTILHQWLGEFFDPARVAEEPHLCGPEAAAAGIGGLATPYVLAETAV